MQQLDARHNVYFGSLFRTGHKQTQFAAQVMRYADLYSCKFERSLNLLNGFVNFFPPFVFVFVSFISRLFPNSDSFTNLVNYPTFYHFTADVTSLPHEILNEIAGEEDDSMVENNITTSSATPSPAIRRVPVFQTPEAKRQKK
jgi:hypothetical protein